MAEATLHLTVQAHIQRRNELQRLISELQSTKSLAIYSQTDEQSLLSSEKHSVRDYFKGLWDEDPELRETYASYTEIPDFEEEIDRITAMHQEKIAELAAWELSIDNEITTASTELEEVKAYLDSYKQMLSSNISDDFDYGLGG